jgi:hypothetical protein
MSHGSSRLERGASSPPATNIPQATPYGRDDATPNVTCVRADIPVVDLAEAHVPALKERETDPESGATQSKGSDRMVILSHRGYWSQPQEKNTLMAFQRSFTSGFGTELDLRDYCGNLVVSHDIADSACPAFSDVLELYRAHGKGVCLAINIKADGLQRPLLNMLNTYCVENYFVFDMSIPDAIGYLNHRMNYFTRQSEFETIPSLYRQAAGVWMDEFDDHWITAQHIQPHLADGKKVCIVSAELHGRAHSAAWSDYKKMANGSHMERFMLCTDLPQEAKEYFND